MKNLNLNLNLNNMKKLILLILIIPFMNIGEINAQITNFDGTIKLKKTSTSADTDKILAKSRKGTITTTTYTVADLAGGGAPTLQEVTDEGNLTTNDILVDAGNGNSTLITPNHIEFTINPGIGSVTMFSGRLAPGQYGMSYDDGVRDQQLIFGQGLGSYTTFIPAVAGQPSLQTLVQQGAFSVAPSSDSDTGVTGEVRIVGAFRYDCINTNTWVRSVVTTSF